MDRIADPRVPSDVGAGISIPQVVQSAENIVVIAGGKRELQECGIDDFARRAPAEETTLEQILLAAPSGRRDLRRRPNGSLILEQPLQHANRGVERRARTLRRLAVPTTVIQLLADE